MFELSREAQSTPGDQVRRNTARRLSRVLAITAATGVALKYGVPPVVHALEHRDTPAHCEVTVQPGETLWEIAGREVPQRPQGPEVADIRQLNHLSTADIQPGQKLELCAPAPTADSAPRPAQG